jgi:predicted dehydrogenase
MTPVRIGVVGLGRFGALHARTIRGLAEAELVALVDTNIERCEAVQSEVGMTPTWNNIEQAVRESSAEAWVVATNTAAHVSTAQTILAAGQSVLLEKPIATRLEEARLLAPLVHEDSRNLMMGHLMLFNSEVRQLLHEVSTRGAIAFLEGVRHRPAKLLQEYPNETPHRLIMVHDLYVVHALFDRAEPKSITARFHRNDNGDIVGVTAILEWPGGAMATLVASYLTPLGMSGDGFDRMEVFGQGWAARIQTNPRPMEVWDERALWPLELEIRENAGAPTGMLAEELRCFCRVVRGVQRVPIGATFTDALRIEHWLAQMDAQSTLTL